VARSPPYHRRLSWLKDEIAGKGNNNFANTQIILIIFCSFCAFFSILRSKLACFRSKIS
jgi:hypothetical protein